MPATISTTAQTTAQDAGVRPFRIDVPEEELSDLRRRIAATRWPDKEPVSDRSQGVQLAQLCYVHGLWSFPARRPLRRSFEQPPVVIPVAERRIAPAGAPCVIAILIMTSLGRLVTVSTAGPTRGRPAAVPGQIRAPETAHAGDPTSALPGAKQPPRREGHAEHNQWRSR